MNDHMQIKVRLNLNLQQPRVQKMMFQDHESSLTHDDSPMKTMKKTTTFPMNLKAEPLVTQLALGSLTIRFLRPGDEHFIPRMNRLLKYRRKLEGDRDFLGKGFYIPKNIWCQMKPINQNFHIIAIWTPNNNTIP